MGLSKADHSVSPPRVEIPRDYNAAEDLIERNLQAGRGGKVAFVDDAGQLTYAELAERANRFGSGLGTLGLEMEDRILIAMLDTVDWPTAFLGAIKAGIVPIAVNTLLTTKDYEFMLSDSRARALVVSEALLPQFKPLLGKLPFLKHVIVSGAPFNEILVKGQPRLAAAPTTRDDTCFWLYSSGSTGTPKGTVHVHSSPILTAELYARPVLGIRESDVVFSAAKLFFAYGLGNALTFPMSVGATTVLMAERPTPASVFKRLVERKPTIFYGVPTLYEYLKEHKDTNKANWKRLKLVLSGADTLHESTMTGWEKRTGSRIVEGYGLSETSAASHVNPLHRPKPGSFGCPVPNVLAAVIDPETRAFVPPGETGELVLAGPNVMLGYWGKPEESARVFFEAGGVRWLRTGDIVRMDEEGYFHFYDRAKDLIKYKGYSIFAKDVEDVLYGHPQVKAAGVIGVPDPAVGQLIKAIVVLQGDARGKLSEEQIKAYCREQLAEYKVPQIVEFRGELPKTDVGKVSRRELREESA